MVERLPAADAPIDHHLHLGESQRLATRRTSSRGVRQKGDFYVILRMYQPSDAVLNGTYQMREMTRVN